MGDDIQTITAEEKGIILPSSPSSVSSTSSTSSRELEEQQDTHKKEPLPPPWSFQASHIYYQFRWMKTEHVQKHTNLPTKDNLFLISFGKYTLGGIFCISYDESPIGPYNEIAILSGLVCSAKFPSVNSIGAWASHILVDSEQAVKYGKQFWGLPAYYTSTISGMDDNKNKNNNDDDEVDDIETKTKLIFKTNDNEIEINGWTGKSCSINNNDNNFFNRLDISLPSLSGCLPLSQLEEEETSKTMNEATSTTTTPLLQYPLRIKNPKSIRFLSKDHPQQLQIDFVGSTDDNDRTARSTTTAFREIQELLKDSKTIFSFVLDDICLEAGVAKEI